MLTLCLLLAAATEPAPPVFGAANEELREYLLLAAENNPSLLAQHERILAALQRIPQATSLEDPMFTYGQFLQSEMNRFRVMLSQKFPWFGTLRLRGERAAAEVDAAIAEFYAERNRIFADVKQAYFNYAFLAQQMRVTEAQAQVLDYFADIVNTRYALGTAAQDQLFRVQIEQTQVADALAQFDQLRPSLGARLNALIGHPANTELPWPESAPLPVPPPEQDVVLALVAENNPSLDVYGALAESAAAGVELARKAGYPDLDVALEYMSVSKPRQMAPDRPPADLFMSLRQLRDTFTGQAAPDVVATFSSAYAVATSREPMEYSDGGEDEIALSLSMNLPIYRKRIRAGVLEAKHEENAIRHDEHEERLMLEAAAQAARYEYDDAARRYALYRDALIPQAQQTYEALQNAYASGAVEADFLDMLDSVQTLLVFDLAQVEARRDLHLAAAELEYLMGGAWTTEPAPEEEKGLGAPEETTVPVEEAAPAAGEMYGVDEMDGVDEADE